MSLSPADVAELRQLLASAVRGKGQIEVIELSHSAFTRSYYLAHQIKDDFQVTLETGESVTVQYAPMTVEKESSGSLLLGDRSITIQQQYPVRHHPVELVPEGGYIHASDGPHAWATPGAAGTPPSKGTSGTTGATGTWGTAGT